MSCVKNICYKHVRERKPKMKLTLHIVFGLSIGAVLCTKCIQQSEPSCSRFDYESNLLAKAIRMEMSMDDIVNNVTEVQTTMANCESKIAAIEARLNELESKSSDTNDNADIQKRTCPSTYKLNKELNLCWKLRKSSNKQNWFDAQEICEDEGGHLIIFSPANVVNVGNALRFIQEWLLAVDANEVFVGASDMMEEGVYKWMDGTIADNIQWHSGQPGGGVNENCLMMKKSYGYKFGDRACGIKLEYLCQITMI